MNIEVFKCRTTHFKNALYVKYGIFYMFKNGLYRKSPIEINEKFHI